MKQMPNHKGLIQYAEEFGLLSYRWHRFTEEYYIAESCDKICILEKLWFESGATLVIEGGSDKDLFLQVQKI